MISALFRATVEERLARADADDEADQQQIDAEVRDRGDHDLSEQEYGPVPAQRRDRRARDDRREPEHGCVVGDTNRRAMLEQLHDRRGEPDDHTRLPAVEDDARGAEDEAERDAAGVDSVERHRVTLRQRRRCEQAGDPGERQRVERSGGKRGRGRDRDEQARYRDRQDDCREPRGHCGPRTHEVSSTSPRCEAANPSSRGLPPGPPGRRAASRVDSSATATCFPPTAGTPARGFCPDRSQPESLEKVIYVLAS